MCYISADATPFLFQLKTVVKRNNVALWRSPDYVFTRLFIHAFISLFVSLSLLQLGTSVRDLQYRVSKFERYVKRVRADTFRVGIRDVSDVYRRNLRQT
jgi:hypothetical protein